MYPGLVRILSSLLFARLNPYPGGVPEHGRFVLHPAKSLSREKNVPRKGKEGRWDFFDLGSLSIRQVVDDTIGDYLALHVSKI